MSEQNPFAPVGAPVMAPPAQLGMTAPQGFARPPMAGFAPPPAAAQPSYQSAGMALTELSFAPLPTEVAAAPVEPPPPAGQSLVANVLPSGGVARSLSLGGRLPMIALVLVLLLGAAGAAYATGLFSKKKEAAAPIVKGKPSVTAPQVSAPAPVVPAKPAVKTLVGKTLSVTKANSGTLGAAYSVTVPAGWISTLKVDQKENFNTDLNIVHARTGQTFFMGSFEPTFLKGPLSASAREALLADFQGSNPTAALVEPSGPDSVRATVGGVSATGFDATRDLDGEPISMRVIPIENNGVIYVAVWLTKTAEFAKSLGTFEQIAATVKFAK
ncbi:MAG: hypothetical protein ABIM89_19005 [Mycobacteriales bacterium]